MKNTSKSFDELIKSKLDEVEVNPSFADAYWQQMQLPVVRQTGINKFRRYYWFGAFVLFIVLVILAVTTSDKNVASNPNAKTIQQLNKVTLINTYNAEATVEKKQADVRPVVTGSKENKKNNLNKSASQKIPLADNQLQNKSDFDSTTNHQTTVKLKGLTQIKEDDTLNINKESVQYTGIQQANINLERIDSVNKKPEAKKKAPHIIW